MSTNMNVYINENNADSDAQQPGGGRNPSASTTRKPATGVAVPPVSLQAGAGLSVTEREEEMKGPREEEMLQEYEQWMDQAEKADKEETMEIVQEKKSKVSNPTPAATPTIIYSCDGEDMEGIVAGGGVVGASGGGEGGMGGGEVGGGGDEGKQRVGGGDANEAGTCDAPVVGRDADGAGACDVVGVEGGDVGKVGLPSAHCGNASTTETATDAETAGFSDSAPPKGGMEPEEPIGEKQKKYFNPLNRIRVTRCESPIQEDSNLDDSGSESNSEFIEVRRRKTGPVKNTQARPSTPLNNELKRKRESTGKKSTAGAGGDELPPRKKPKEKSYLEIARQGLEVTIVSSDSSISLVHADFEHVEAGLLAILLEDEDDGNTWDSLKNSVRDGTIKYALENQSSIDFVTKFLPDIKPREGYSHTYRVWGPGEMPFRYYTCKIPISFKGMNIPEKVPLCIRKQNKSLTYSEGDTKSKIRVVKNLTEERREKSDHNIHIKLEIEEALFKRLVDMDGKIKMSISTVQLREPELDRLIQTKKDDIEKELEEQHKADELRRAKGRREREEKREKLRKDRRELENRFASTHIQTVTPSDDDDIN